MEDNQERYVISMNKIGIDPLNKTTEEVMALMADVIGAVKESLPERKIEKPILKYKGKDKKVLEWNVILYEHDKIRIYNVFNNAYFSEAITDIMHTPNLSRNEISELIERKARWQFWGRCEYEYIMSSWPPYKEDKGYKIDVFEQLTLNWGRFIDYIIGVYNYGKNN